MKYSVQAHQPKDFLQKVDEIKLQYKDRETLYDYETWGLMDKDIVISIPYNEQDIDWDFLSVMAEKMNLTLALGSMLMINECLKRHIKYYWNYPVSTYYDLEGVLYCGVSQVQLAAPLTFDLERVTEIIPEEVKIRVVANMAYEYYLPHRDGIEGFFIRPEDVELYEPYIDIIEFMTSNLEQERQLFTIYTVDKKWPGNLRFIINNLDVDVDNRGLNGTNFAEERLVCGQKCKRNFSCNFCYNTIRFIDFVKHTLKEENDD